MLLSIGPLAFGQPGTISGTVVDTSGSSVARAQVKLSLDGRAPDQETQSADSGDFAFTNVAAGPYHLSFTAKGFALKTISGELHVGETLNLARTALTIDTVTTEVNVTETQAEVAEAQIKVEEIPGAPGSYNAVAWLRPWLQMEELTASLRMVAKIPKLGS